MKGVHSTVDLTLARWITLYNLCDEKTLQFGKGDDYTLITDSLNDNSYLGTKLDEAKKLWKDLYEDAKKQRYLIRGNLRKLPLLRMQKEKLFKSFGLPVALSITAMLSSLIMIINGNGLESLTTIGPWFNVLLWSLLGLALAATGSIVVFIADVLRTSMNDDKEFESRPMKAS